jgi:single-stranded-DNA-specific exonuclease
MGQLGTSDVDELLKRVPPAVWELKAADQAALDALAGSPWSGTLPFFVRRLLALRGFSEEQQARRFMEPKLQHLEDPFLLPGMAEAVERLTQAIERKETVVIYGDYDVDGVTSMALLTWFLRAHLLDPRGFLPIRTEEGYGLSLEGLERMLVEGKPDLLIAVDCGTCSTKEVKWLNKRGVDVMILDHHEPPADELPPAILVNPKLGNEARHLCSAGVVFKVLHAWQKTHGQQSFDLREHLDLVALGTVADIVPLHGENRVFVKKGLPILAASQKAGVQALLKVAGVPANPTASHIGFQIGPRINAAGRIDSAEAAYQLLTTEDPEEAKEISEFLDEQNRERQTLERTIFEEAQRIIAGEFDPDRHAAIVIGSRNWHPGVVGIVSSRLTRMFHRPSVVVAFDENGLGKGSGRSVEGFHLVDIIRDCQDCLKAGGGHAMAAGITVEEGRFDEFRQRFLEAASRMSPHCLIPRLRLEAEIPLGEIHNGLLAYLDMLEPYGEGNARPIFFARRVWPERHPMTIKEKHMRLFLIQDGRTKEAIWFNSLPEDLPEPPWDIAFSLERNVWQGRENIQIQMRAIRASGALVC